MHYPIWTLELPSNILWMIVAHTLSTPAVETTTHNSVIIIIIIIIINLFFVNVEIVTVPIN